jgi:hypothetical protein
VSRIVPLRDMRKWPGFSAASSAGGIGLARLRHYGDGPGGGSPVCLVPCVWSRCVWSRVFGPVCLVPCVWSPVSWSILVDLLSGTRCGGLEFVESGLVSTGYDAAKCNSN